MAVDPNSTSFRYGVTILYIVQATLVTFILICELRSFYYSIYPREISQMSTPSQNSDLSVGSSSAKSPSSKSPDSHTFHPKPMTVSVRSRSESTPHHSSKKSNEPKLIFILPCLSYIFYILMAICGAVSVMGVSGCIIFAHSGPICFDIAKMFMYFVFLYRLYIVYSDSAFAYNTKLLWILGIIVIFYQIMKNVINMYTREFVIFYNVNNERLCAIYAQSFVIAMGALFDIIISILCCILFIRPLLIINQATKSDQREVNVEKKLKKQKKKENALFAVIVKYLILTIATITSTLILGALMAVLKFSSLIAIDNIINCICILLFSQYYNYYYKIICCGPIACCDRMCNRTNK